MDMGIGPGVHKEPVMNAMKIAGIALIVAGGLALAYGGFSFTKETHNAQIGPLSLSVKEKEQVNVPQWLGIGAIVAGIVLLVLPSKK
jgi:multidrug transporter EmrE-like cation transporter